MTKIDVRPRRFSAHVPAFLTASGTTAVTILAAGLFGVVSTRALGPTERGLLAAAVVWTSVLGSIVAIGVPQGVTYHVGRRPDRAGRYASTGLVMGAALGACLAVIGVVCTVFLAPRGARLAMALLFVALIPGILAGVGNGAVLGIHAYRRWGLLRIVNPAIALGALVLLVLAGGDTALVAATAMATGTFVSAAVVVWSMGRIGLLARPDMGAARDLLSYGWRQAVSATAWLLNYKLDQLVLTVAVAPAALGLYAVAASFGEVIVPVAASTGAIVLARTAGGDRGTARDSLRAAIVFCLLITMVVGGTIAVFAEQLLRLLFGAPFAAAADVLRILLIGAPGLAVGTILGDTLRGLNRPLDPAKAEILGAVAMAIMLALLVPGHGIRGAAVATAVVYNLVMVLLAVLVWVRLREHEVR